MLVVGGWWLASGVVLVEYSIDQQASHDALAYAAKKFPRCRSIGDRWGGSECVFLSLFLSLTSNPMLCCFILDFVSPH